jgi:hypothetical protein
MAPPSLANEPVAGVNVIALPQSPLRMQELGGLPLVLMPVEYCLRKLMEAECAEAQIEAYVVLELNNSEGIDPNRAFSRSLQVLRPFDKMHVHCIGPANFANRFHTPYSSRNPWVRKSR